MPETWANRGKRHLRQCDNSLVNSMDELFHYHYLMLRADVALAAAIEMMLLDLAATRQHLADLYLAAWEVDAPWRDKIHLVEPMILEARKDVLGRKFLCQVYSSVWGRSPKELSRLLEKRAEASLKR